MSNDNDFVDGLFVDAPHPKAPDFVKAKIALNVEALGKYLRTKYQAGEEWVRLDVKESKGGKWYAAINDWKPDDQSGPPSQEDLDDDVPF